MTVIVLFGSRQEASKMAPVVRRLKETAELDVDMCGSAQHREMLDRSAFAV